MASSSSSPTQEKYDVFLSFRGEDTRKGFTSHLHAALCRTKIKTFIDDELKRGDEISLSLLKAIEGSKISIVIFSKHYASSRWCLDELVKIMDCNKMHGQIVIPVFYHVNPSDVRKQTGTYGDAFTEHEVRCRQSEEVLQRCRSALTDATNLSGFDSNVVRLESKLIEKIVQDILKRLKNMSSSNNENLVGIARKIQKVKSLLPIGTNEVCQVGIWGMGGIGKTTLAKAVFNDISSQFEASYFIQNVREASEKGELSHLRKELLSTILEDEHPNIMDASTIERLRRIKVLFVFDDVTHLNQINELIGGLENLGLGSQIIITTRDKQVLESCRVDNATIYEVKGLYSGESFCLFSQRAFKKNYPIEEDYMALSKRVINYAKGVPLALEVLGSFLRGRKKHEWESTLEKLKICPHQDIQSVLKISYDGLDDEEKKIFLDVACFFNGWDEHLVRKFSSSIGLRVLIDKALITISRETIRVHDLLQEMGKEIVQKESVDEPGRRSRLWRDNDVYGVLKKNKGTDKIRGLCFNISTMRELHLYPHAFSEMDYLRYLIVNTSSNSNVHGFEGIEFDFTELRCLFWDSYPFTSLPLKFDPQNLVVLRMRKSNLEQLWSGIKDLANIKYIDLSYSEHLLKVPDLSEAQNLECLILEDCTSLFEITPPTRDLNKLVNLNLRNCKSLSSLPNGIQSKSLREVILSGCSSLNTAPRISCNMERLCLDGTAIKELSSSIDYPSRLVELNLKGCSRLESLPSSVCNLNSLRQLNLSDGTAIKELSSSIENASSLVRLNLKNCSSLESLPNGVCKLNSLKCLCISGCLKLDRLPEDIGNLESLEVLEANGIPLREVPSSLGRLKNLHHLSFERCKSQELKSLSPILPGFLFLRRLNLNHCSLTELPNNLGHLSFLTDLKLDGNNFESVPTSIINLSALNLLSIRFCNRLQSLPKLPCNMQEVKADGCKLLKVLSGMKGPSDGYYYGELSFINCFNLDWNAVRMVLKGALMEVEKLRIGEDYVVRRSIKERAGRAGRGYMVFPGSEIPKRKERAGRAGRGYMVFPGSEIPKWFNIQSNGSCIELLPRVRGTMPYKLLGFVFCAIVGIPKNHCGLSTVGYVFRLPFQNRSEPLDSAQFNIGHIKSDHLFVGYSFGISGFSRWTGTAEAIINFYSPNDLIIKKCGVRLFVGEQFLSLDKIRGHVLDNVLRIGPDRSIGLKWIKPLSSRWNTVVLQSNRSLIAAQSCRIPASFDV
ncbi:TMV resistance protein N-like [Pistacia vera]|uniref:TMV resistance protein N-like n=1 Tax=Pistacia vera TaxID=55513 RepID=UPI00126332C8|nr:TMV resistance protein N-like [Pistacia vera]